MDPDYLGYEVEDEAPEAENSTGPKGQDPDQDQGQKENPKNKDGSRACKRLGRKIYSECRRACDDGDRACKDQCRRDVRDFMRDCLSAVKEGKWPYPEGPNGAPKPKEDVKQ